MAYTTSWSLQKGVKIPPSPKRHELDHVLKLSLVWWARYHWKIFQITYSRATMEDLEAVSSQKESTYDDDTHTSLATEDESY